MIGTDWTRKRDRLAGKLRRTLRAIFAIERSVEDVALDAQSSAAARKRYDEMNRELERLREKAKELEFAEEAANRRAEEQATAEERARLADAKKKAGAAAKAILTNAQKLDGTLASLEELISEHQGLVHRYLVAAQESGQPNLAVRKLLGLKERTIGYAVRAKAPTLFSILRPHIPSAVDHAKPLRETYGALL